MVVSSGDATGYGITGAEIAQHPRKLGRISTKVEVVSKCQTSYIEDANAPVDNNGDVAGRGDTVQTECH